MGGFFESSDSHSAEQHRPIRVAVRREDIWEAAKQMAQDMSGWELQSADDSARILVCKKAGGMLAGTATITITVEGLEEVPSTTVHAKSETSGGVMARDKSNVGEFMKIFHRRIC